MEVLNSCLLHGISPSVPTVSSYCLRCGKPYASNWHRCQRGHLENHTGTHHLRFRAQNVTPFCAMAAGVPSTSPVFNPCPYALFVHALRCLNGHGADRDITQAAELLRLSATKGYIPAYYHLGLCFLKGDGVYEDEMEAVACFRLGYSWGLSTGGGQVGEMYPRRNWDRAKPAISIPHI